MTMQNPSYQNTTTSFLIMDDSSSANDSDGENVDPSLIPLTPLRIQFLSSFIYDVLMASSDVDQKFLGKFAQQTESIDPYLSQQLYKILGLSVLLSKKLFRARRLRRLDVTRDTKSLQLYHHIIWLSREGLVILEVAVLPAVLSRQARLPDLAEMRVLAQKLQGSFYHIFVLFHNQPSINRAADVNQRRASTSHRSSSIRKTVALDVRNPASDTEADEDPYSLLSPRNPPTQSLPPGLAPIAIPKPTASFLLPATDYIPNASTAFDRSMKLARELLGGSHPLRLSVAVEYCAYLYDCLHDGESSRSLAKVTIRNVYSANEGMDDETFADAANLVSVLGKMMKRGLSGSSGTGAAGSEGGRTGTSGSRSQKGDSPKRGKKGGDAGDGGGEDYIRPLQPRPHGQSGSPSQSRAYAPSSPRTRDRVHITSGNSPQRVTHTSRSPQTTRSPQTSRNDTSQGLANSYWAPNPAPSSPRPATRDRSNSNSNSHSYSPLERPRLPATTTTSPKSPGAQKLPKMTPWEPPSPETARKKERERARAMEEGGGSPSLRGGGKGSGGFVRKNEGTNGKVKVGRTMTPDESVRMSEKEEKRRRVEVAEKRSRSSEKMRNGGGSSDKMRVKGGSRERLDAVAVNGSGSVSGRSRRRR